MKFSFNQKTTAPIQVLFFNNKNKKILSTTAEKNFLENILANQKDKFLITFNQKIKFLLAAIDKIATPAEFLAVGGKIGKNLLSKDSLPVDLILPNSDSLSKDNLQALLEGVLLGCYQFQNFFSKKEKHQPKAINLISNFATLKSVAKKAEILAEANSLARDCANLPGNYFYPESFVKEAKKISKANKNIKTIVLDKKHLQKEKMNCLLGVSQGSAKNPYLVIMQYKSMQKSKETVLLVGKGLTFDCGGISIKPSAKMDEMKFDMCGGAAVLGAMQAIAKLKPNVNVVALIPTSENLVNGSALKPGDILTAYNGKTIEIGNTDAEGRLILADALAYGVNKFKPNAVIDLATLTGACVVALGKHNCGMMSDNQKLAEMLENFGKKTGEKVWQLPIDKEYQKQIKGDYADLKNAAGGGAGTITAGMFLKNFVDDVPWAHLDIAGTAWDGEKEYHTKGATGFGVRLLAYLLENWQTIKL